MKIRLILVLVAVAVSGGVVQAEGAPFYQDKFNLLCYIDAQGQQQPIKTATEWQLRRDHILANIKILMGEFPGKEKSLPLDIQVTRVEELDKVIRKTISYASEPGHRVPAYLLLPKNTKGKVPAMLCLHGTGGSKGRVVGLGADYARYGIELAERGYVTIAPDYITLGDNTTHCPYKDLGYISCSMKGIWDHMRAVDLLQSLPEVDEERIGVIGNSLGGHNSLFVSVFDQRLKVAVSSVGFDSFRDYMGGEPGKLKGWAGFRYMPLIAEKYNLDAEQLPFDFPEILAAIAPRAVFAHSPLEDHNFRVESARKCVAAAHPVFELLGATDKLKIITPEGKHHFDPAARQAAYEFIDGVFGVKQEGK